MRETSKCEEIRRNRGDFDNFLKGKGIDIGAGDDVLKIPNGTVRPWDKGEGNAQLMAGVPDNEYDFVYSSHCLEHMVDVTEALTNWLRILTPGGCANGFVDSDSHTRFAQRDLVARAQTNAARSRRHLDRSTAADDARPVLAAVVVQSMVAGWIDGDVRVAARNGLVHRGRPFDEHDVVGPEQPVTAVADLGASPEIDPGHGERVRAPLGDASQHRNLEARGRRVDRRRSGGGRDPVEGHVKLRIVPTPCRPADIRDIDLKIGHVAPGRSQPIDDTVSE